MLGRIVASSTMVFALLLWATAAAGQQDTDPGAAPEAPRGTAQLTLDDLRTFTDVFNQARLNYVEEIDDHTLLDSAIRGMLHELDPHSAYIPQSEFQAFEDNSQGRYVGVGVDLRADQGRIFVRAVINGSPADEAGINPGDEVTAIDGEPVEGRDPEDVIDKLMGEPESETTLEILSPAGEQRTVTLQRKYLQIPVLSYRPLDRSWGYFKITLFHRHSAKDLEQSLQSIADDGVELSGLVLDLRDNPGGVLQGAIEMADGFLDEGLIVTTRGRNAKMQMEFSANSGQWLPETPLLILVDRGSASASEVLAGALQDHRRALIVGERTFGKGSVQSVLPLRNGGGIKLTTARYYTPSGRSIQAEGIVPDVVYEAGGLANADTSRRREADLARHLNHIEPSGESASASGVEPTPAIPVEEALGVLEAAGILVPGNGAGSGRSRPETPARGKVEF